MRIGTLPAVSGLQVQDRNRMCQQRQGTGPEFQ
jgi:hypothetical protein